MIPAGSPHNRIKIPKEGTATWTDGFVTTAALISAGTMIERTTHAAASPNDHQPSRVLGHLMMRLHDELPDGGALVGSPEWVFIPHLVYGGFSLRRSSIQRMSDIRSRLERSD
jgi:hypothetical protein